MNKNNFFPGIFRMLTLTSFDVKLNAQKEKRVRIDFEMPLNNENFKTPPDQVSAAYMMLAKAENGVLKMNIVTEYEGITASLFETTESPNPSLVLQAVTIRGLQMERPEGADLKDGDILLKFHLNVPHGADTSIVDWADFHLGATVFAKFELAQGDLFEDADPNRQSPEAKAAVDKMPVTSGKAKAAGKDVH